MNNVHSLPGVQPINAGPNPGLIASIRDLLDRAERGELQSFIGAGFNADGTRVALWGGSHANVYEMLGSLGWLQHEYVHRVTGENDG